MDLTLHIWRQSGPTAQGGFVTYTAKGVSPDTSFPEMFDVLDEQLIEDEVAQGAERCGSVALLHRGVPLVSHAQRTPAPRVEFHQLPALAEATD